MSAPTPKIFATEALIDVMNRVGRNIAEGFINAFTRSPWEVERERRMSAYRALWAKDGTP